MNMATRLRICISPQLQSRLITINSSRFHPRLTALAHRTKTSKSPPAEEIDLDEPIKFSTSRAATWKPRDTYGRHQEEGKNVWLQPVVVSLSTAIFLLYFCVFRQENDLDTKLTKTLFDHIDGLEEKQLEIALKHNLETGQDTRAILMRLAEIQNAKEETASETSES